MSMQSDAMGRAEECCSKEYTTLKCVAKRCAVLPANFKTSRGNKAKPGAGDPWNLQQATLDAASGNLEIEGGLLAANNFERLYNDRLTDRIGKSNRVCEACPKKSIRRDVSHFDYRYRYFGRVIRSHVEGIIRCDGRLGR